MMKKRILEGLRKLWGIPQMQWEITEKIKDQVRILHGELRREQLAACIMNTTTLGISDERYGQENVIVTLTSFGPRLYDTAFAIESIMQQTCRPNRIVLWLAHDDYKRIPRTLRMQQERGLEIRECDDLRSYKKIIPSLREFPNEVLVTIDDDVMYDADVLERLITCWQSEPQYIYCCRAHRMRLNTNQQFEPYSQWDWGTNEIGPHRLNFFTGVGGVLYPPHCLDERVLDESTFMSICRTADDVWLNAMALLKGTMVSRVSTRNPHGEDYVEGAAARLSNLSTVNASKNDVQLKTVYTKYSLYDKLSK